MLAHANDFGNNLCLGPLYAEDFRQLLEVDSCGFTDAVDVVAQPGHAEVTKLLVEERLAKLGGEQGDILDDSLANAPGLVFRELHNGRQETLGEQLDTNDCGYRHMRSMMSG